MNKTSTDSHVPIFMWIIRYIFSSHSCKCAIWSILMNEYFVFLSGNLGIEASFFLWLPNYQGPWTLCLQPLGGKGICFCYSSGERAHLTSAHILLVRNRHVATARCKGTGNLSPVNNSVMGRGACFFSGPISVDHRIYFFSNYFLRAYQILSTVLGAGDETMTK